MIKVKIYTFKISAILSINFHLSLKAFFSLLTLISQTVQPPCFFQESPDFAWKSQTAMDIGSAGMEKSPFDICSDIFKLILMIDTYARTPNRVWCPENFKTAQNIN